MSSADENIEKPIVVRNSTDLQRLKLEKLMKNPDKPVIIPERPKERGVPTVPDFVRNVMGSSAGAGSGEFHVYRHLRRKEYARQRYMKEKGERERLDDEYKEKLEQNKKLADEKTAKKRAKRMKRKLKQKVGCKKPRADTKSESEEESSDDDTSSNNSGYEADMRSSDDKEVIAKSKGDIKSATYVNKSASAINKDKLDADKSKPVNKCIADVKNEADVKCGVDFNSGVAVQNKSDLKSEVNSNNEIDIKGKVEVKIDIKSNADDNDSKIDHKSDVDDVISTTDVKSRAQIKSESNAENAHAKSDRGMESNKKEMPTDDKTNTTNEAKG